MWDVVPWVLLAAGLGLIGWMIWLKFNGREIPSWMKWLSYALNAFAMLALALRGIGRRPPDTGDDEPPTLPSVPKPEPHIDNAEEIIEDAKNESEKAGEEKREEGDDKAASGFTSSFGSNIGAPKPPEE